MAVVTDLVKTNKNKGNMYQVFLDGEDIGLFHIEALVKSGVFVGKDIEEKTLKNAIKESSKLLAFEQALKYVTKSCKTEKEIHQYLLTKGYEEEVVLQVIAKLREYNYIDDMSYAMSFINANSNSKGRYRLRFELKGKGVSDEIINKALELFNDDSEVLMKLAQKYMRSKDITPKNLSKLYQYLVGRGFGSEEINAVISRIKLDTLEEEYDWL